jgi:hypothetical protein
MSGYQKRRKHTNKNLETVEERAQSDAARNGRKAEEILAGHIQSNDDSTKWIVEEISENSYSKTGAKHRAGIEKPDVVLFDRQSGKDYGFISLKCCKDFATAFNQIKRCSLTNFCKEFSAPKSIELILEKYTYRRKKLLRDGNNYSQNELEELLLFLNKNQKPLLISAFTGQAKQPKANWLLLHQWKFPDWQRNIACRDRSRLISMQEVIATFEDIQATFTKRGTITFGAGVTLQRKGGDNGKESANDLQFKLRIAPLLEALAKFRK